MLFAGRYLAVVTLMGGLTAILAASGLAWWLWLLVPTALFAALVLWIRSARMIADYRRRLLEFTS